MKPGPEGKKKAYVVSGEPRPGTACERETTDLLAFFPPVENSEITSETAPDIPTNPRHPFTGNP